MLVLLSLVHLRQLVLSPLLHLMHLVLFGLGQHLPFVHLFRPAQGCSRSCGRAIGHNRHCRRG